MTMPGAQFPCRDGVCPWPGTSTKVAVGSESASCRPHAGGVTGS
jgi:hypothetical protein